MMNRSLCASHTLKRITFDCHDLHDVGIRVLTTAHSARWRSGCAIVSANWMLLDEL